MLKCFNEASELNMAQTYFNSLHCDTSIIHSREITAQGGKQWINMDGCKKGRKQAAPSNPSTFIWIYVTLSCKYMHTHVRNTQCVCGWVCTH